MVTLTLIQLRTNHMRSQEPFLAAFLLDDERYAVFVSPEAGGIFLLPVVPFTNGLYAQDGDNVFLGYLPYKRDRATDATVIAGLVDQLRSMSGYELITRYYDQDDNNGFPLVDCPDDPDEDLDEPPYDKYGRHRR